MSKDSLFYEDVAKNRLKMVISATKIGLWDLEMRKGVKNACLFSDELRQMLGYENELDFPNAYNFFQDRVHLDDRDRVHEAYRQHVSDYTGKTPYDIEYRMYKKDGELRHFRDTGITLRSDDGRPMHTTGVLLDVTNEYQAKLANELQLLNHRLMNRATGVGMWNADILYDADGQIASIDYTFSDEFRAVFGYTSESDLPNSPESNKKYTSPDDYERVLNLLEAHLYDKEGKTSFDTEYKAVKKNGDAIYVHTCCESVRDENGVAIHTSGAVRDITQYKSLLAETEKRRLDAEAANAAKSVFLSTMSHEIRSPMNAILGITEIELQKESLSAEIREAFERIHSSGDLLLSIINDILDLSKVEAGKLELQNARYDMESLLSDTAQLNMLRLASKQIEFELHADEALASELIGDELRIKQILNNLLSNAVKYTDKGTVRLSASTYPGTEENIEILKLVVSDTGQGMSKEQVSKLFDKYSRFNTEANRYTEGTGLGMNITHNLVSLMNGEIFVESEPEKGSVFTVLLPQVSCGAAAIGKASADNLKQLRSQSFAKMKRVKITREPMPYGKVLIVDDLEINIYVAKGLLTPYELNVDSAHSGYEAIEKIKSGYKYDVIFMDHMMPEIDGIETTRVIREVGYTNPIVALTANVLAGQDKLFLNNGFDDFISKPIDVRQLNLVLNRLVRDKHSLKTVKEARESAAAKASQSDKASSVNSTLSTKELSFKHIGTFLKDAEKSATKLNEMFSEELASDMEKIRAFAVTIHGLKSALLIVGNKELSSVAAELEQLAYNIDIRSINSKMPDFLNMLMAFIEQVKELNQAADYTSLDNAAMDSDYNMLIVKLNEIKAACADYDDVFIESTLSELESKTWSKETNILLDFITDQVLLSGFDKIIEEVEKFCTQNK